MSDNWETRGLEDNFFHSSRKERHDLGGITCEDDKRTFFQRNPSFRILIIDLILIVIIAGVIIPFLYKREGTTTLEGYKMTMRAFHFDDQVMASLTVKSSKDDVVPGEILEVKFHFNDDQQSAMVQDITPEPGEERILKAILNKSESEYAYATIQLMGQEISIKKKIK